MEKSELFLSPSSEPKLSSRRSILSVAKGSPMKTFCLLFLKSFMICFFCTLQARDYKLERLEESLFKSPAEALELLRVESMLNPYVAALEDVYLDLETLPLQRYPDLDQALSYVMHMTSLVRDPYKSALDDRHLEVLTLILSFKLRVWHEELVALLKDRSAWLVGSEETWLPRVQSIRSRDRAIRKWLAMLGKFPETSDLQKMTSLSEWQVYLDRLDHEQPHYPTKAFAVEKFREISNHMVFKSARNLFEKNSEAFRLSSNLNASGLVPKARCQKVLSEPWTFFYSQMLPAGVGSAWPAELRVLD
jgi:hypothetical protein